MSKKLIKTTTIAAVALGATMNVSANSQLDSTIEFGSEVGMVTLQEQEANIQNAKDIKEGNLEKHCGEFCDPVPRRPWRIAQEVEHDREFSSKFDGLV